MTVPFPSRALDGAEVLDDVAAFIRRYVAFPSAHCLVAVVLWAAHTHANPNTWYVTPRLVLDSAEPGSGKTRVLELLALLVQRPEMTISATVAAIFRMLAEEPYTLLFDEVDAIFNPKNGGNYEDLRALLNAGYKQGATIARCVGDASKMRVERFTVFAPVALAGLAGKMPATITTRAVTIHMRRRGPGEHVEPFRERDAREDTEPLRDQLAAWITAESDALSYARPSMPDGVVDRPAEVWEALLAVADAAGGEWPQLARDACTHFVLSAGPSVTSLGVRLLADLQDLYSRRGVDRLPTGEVVTALVDLEEAPWADLYGRELSPRRLAQELDRYGVRPVQWKQGGDKQRGYVTWATDKPAQTGLTDAWARYLHDGGTPGTPGTPQLSPVPDEEAVPVRPGTAHGPGTGLTREVPGVPGVPAKSSPDVWRRSGRRVRSPADSTGRTSLPDPDGRHL